MELKDYCRSVDMELTGWKAKLYNVISQIDKLPTGDKQRMYEKVNGLHIIMAELDDRLDHLRTACPTEWSPERKTLKGKISDLGDEYDKVEKALFDYDIGG
ncbi:MAG: hypothetical protein AB1413_04090 [Thermodesulfobacteriota bacterium]